MQAALVLVPIILQYLPKVVVGVTELINWISAVRQAAKQSGEWTPELETAFLEALIVSSNSSFAQPDPAPPTPEGKAA